MKRTIRGFTVVELIVVIGIIALLMGLLLPAMSGVKATGRAQHSMSNLRQWGVGYVNFSTVNKDRIPWEGRKNAIDMWVNFETKEWWANAVPPFVEQPPYKKLNEDATAAGALVPVPPDDGSIFVDPGAQAPENAPHQSGGPQSKQFFFCYVPNSQLNNTFIKRIDDPNDAIDDSALVAAAEIDPSVGLRMSQLSMASATVLMLEMRSVREELPPDDPYYNNDLRRHRSDWKRHASRHFDGGHVMFADGHVDLVNNEYATTNTAGNRSPDHPYGDWNKNDLIWDPLGPATDE